MHQFFKANVKCMWVLIYFIIILINVCTIQQAHTKKVTWKPIKKKILFWTPLKTAPPLGTLNFKDCPRKCVLETISNHTNFATFDAVIFHGPDCLKNINFIHQAAVLRNPKQNFIFLSAESSNNFPICDERFDDFFNLTWTYKLNSDILYQYFVIKDKQGVVIGPKQEMNWVKNKNMMQTSESVKTKLKWKFKVAAWLMRIPKTKSQREIYVNELQAALNLHGLSLTVFGKFGLPCDYDNNKLIPNCWELIETNYYFYLSFENSFSEDYVTEKVLQPLKHYTVPIVFGAANYTRFMPDGAYINAMNLKPEELAREINEITNDKKIYQRFFKWRNYYSYHDPLESPETNHLCVLCQRLYGYDLKSEQIYDKFRMWWNEPGACD